MTKIVHIDNKHSPTQGNSVTSPGRKSQTVDRLTAYFASILRVQAQQVRADANVLELGADSIMLVEAQRWLREQFGCSIEVRQFFEDLNTIERIAAYVDAQPVSASNPALPQQAEGNATRRAIPAPAFAASEAAHAIDFDLMQSQLALAADVIEAQNRAIIASLGMGVTPAGAASTIERGT